MLERRSSGAWLYRIAIGLGIGYALALAFHAWGPRGEQVDLLTREDQVCCWLSYGVSDVVADPVSGAPIDQATGRPLRWQSGFTAWRVGTEVEVRDPLGVVVMTTPGRFRITPTAPDFAVGEIERCTNCELGGGPR